MSTRVGVVGEELVQTGIPARLASMGYEVVEADGGQAEVVLVDVRLAAAQAASPRVGMVVLVPDSADEASLPPLHVSVWAPFKSNALRAGIERALYRRDMEARLVESESRFRQLAENIQDVLYLIDVRTGQLLYVSPSYELVWGRSCQSAMEDPLSWLQAVHPDDVERVRSRHMEYLQGLNRHSEPFEQTYRIIRPDGSLRWISTRKYPILNDQGEPWRLTGLARDVTELKLALAAVDREKTSLEEILRSTPAIIYRAVPDGYARAGVHYITENVKTVLGYEPESFVNNIDFWKSRVHPDDVVTAVSDLHRLASMGRMVREYRFLDAQGQWRWMRDDASLRLDADGRPVEIIGYWVEVTAQKLAETERQASDQRWRGMLQNAPVGITLLDRDSRILEANDALATMLGYSIPELQNRSLEDILHPEDVDTHRTAVASLLGGESQRLVYERRLIARSSAQVPVRVTFAAVEGGPGVILTLAVVENITERLKAEEALRKSEAQVRTAQKLEAVGRLSGGVAHDFNNLLTAVAGYAALLEETFSPMDPRIADVGEIKKAVERATALTRRLLAFSRHQAMDPTVVDLNRVVSEMYQILQRLIGEDIVLSTALSDTPCCALVDGGQMEQVLLNLAVNARDAMPGGGILRITTGHCMHEHRGCVFVRVEDSGCGMSAEVLDHIFEPFFTTKEATKGTGLGLSTVYGIVQQSQGFIVVESQQGQGTTFEVRLPATGCVPESPDVQRKSPVATHSASRILVVEDEAPLRAFVCRLLERRGYSVVEAHSSSHALDIACSRGDIDLVVSDVVMPGLSGPELLRLISRTTPIRVVYLTGYAEQELYNPGHMAVINKPFSNDRLIERIEELLSRPMGGMRARLAVL